MKNIFVVTEFVNKESNSTGYFWAKLIKSLSSSKKIFTISTRGVYSNWTRKFIILRVFYKFFVALSLYIRLFFRVKSGDIVISGTNPELLFLFISLHKYLWPRFEFCVLVHDVFPNNLIPSGVLSGNNIFYIFLSKVFKFLYLKVDRFVVIGRDMEQVLRSFGIDQESIMYIPNWVDSSDIHPLDKKKSLIIKEKNWKDKVVYQFFGNLGRVQGLNFILRAINNSLSKNIAFLFAGTGRYAHEINNSLSSNLPMDRYLLLGSVPTKNRSEILSACDIAIVSLTKGMYGLGVPSKGYFSLLANRPIIVIGDPKSELNLLVSEYDCGWVVSSFCVDELSSLFDRLADNPSEIIEKKLNIKKFLKAYDPDYLVNKASYFMVLGANG